VTTYLPPLVRRVAILAAVVCAAAVSPVFAQQAQRDEAFKSGMNALRNKNWKVAIAALQRAIDIDPKEDRRKIGGALGIGGDEYLPYFHLGEASFGGNDCAGAITAWERSDDQGVARKIGNTADIIQRGYMQCETRGYLLRQRLQKELNEATTLYNAANEAYTALQQYVKEHPQTRQATVGAQSSAQANLSSASEKLKSAPSSRRAQDLSDARASAELANRTVEEARRTIATLVAGAEAFTNRIKDAESLLQQADTQLKGLDTALASTIPLRVSPSGTVTDERARAAQQITDARDRLRNSSRAPTDAEVSDVAKTAQDATSLINHARALYTSEVETAIGQELTGLGTRGGELFAQVEGTVRTIEQKLHGRPEANAVAAEFTKLQTDLLRARRNFDRAIKSRDLVGAQTAALAPAQLGPQFDSLAERLGIAEVPDLPDALRRAAQAFFEARYQDVLNALPQDAAGAIPMTLRIHAHVIRSAALFALFEYSGATDDTLRTQARQEADLARGIDAAFQPRIDAFSPRFIKFFLATSSAAR
jgi:hypothetical protein